MEDSMKISGARKWFVDNGIDSFSATSIDWIKKNLKQKRMSWQSVSLELGNENKVKVMRFGYRKYTTGEYVSNKYRAHFGWKNTYYQPAEIIFTFNKVQAQEIQQGFDSEIAKLKYNFYNGCK